MDLLGLQEELDAQERYAKRRKITLWITLPVLTIAILGGAYYFIANNKSNESTKTIPVSPASEVQTEDPLDSAMTDNSVSESPSRTTTQNNNTSPPTTTNTNAQQQQAIMDAENKRLRQQWVADAYSLSADFAKWGALIKKGDAESIKEAKQKDAGLTSKAISLGILQGLPNASEAQIKQDAATLAKQAAVKYADALGWAEAYLKDGTPAWLTNTTNRLNEASALNSQFSQKIQQVQVY